MDLEEIENAHERGAECSVTRLDLAPKETKRVGRKIAISSQGKDKIHYF